jgi:hypothetical protein
MLPQIMAVGVPVALLVIIFTYDSLQRRRERLAAAQSVQEQQNRYVYHRACPSALVLCSVTQSRKMQL